MIRIKLHLSIIIACLVIPACSPGGENGRQSPHADLTPSITPALLPSKDMAEDDEKKIKASETDLPDETRGPVQIFPGEPVQTKSAQEKPVVGEVPIELMDMLIADLVERQGVSPSSIEVIRAEAVVWNDGSLGCPKPGVVYTQSLVNGYWVVIQAEGVDYDYRVSDTGYFLLCDSPLIGGPGTVDYPKE